jgi:hypothetical protein
VKRAGLSTLAEKNTARGRTNSRARLYPLFASLRAKIEANAVHIGQFAAFQDAHELTTLAITLKNLGQVADGRGDTRIVMIPPDPQTGGGLSQ